MTTVRLGRRGRSRRTPAGRRARPAHAVARRPRRAHRLLGAAGAAAVGVLLAVLAAGGSYASLNSSASARPAAVLKAGNAALAVTTPLGLPSTPLYPGLTVRGSAVVQNTGTIPLQLRVAGLTRTSGATDFAAALTVGVAVGASAAACAAGFTPTWSGTFAAAPAGSLPLPALAVGASAVICVSVTLPTSAPATAAGAAATSFTVLLDGRQL